MTPMRLLILATVLGSVYPGILGAQIAEPFGEPELVADIEPGPGSSSPRLFASTEAGAIFTLGDPADPLTPRILWGTDGTAAGTVSLQPEGFDLGRDFYTPGKIHFFQVVNAEGQLALLATDGTPRGTGLVAEDLEVIDARGFDEGRGLFYFTADETGTPFDAEPWVSDGTRQGTKLLKDLAPGPDGASASEFVPFKGRYYFIGLAPDAVGFGLWRTDGTPAGTEFLLPGYRRVWATKDHLYLLSLANRFDLTLHRSDGTAEGTIPTFEFGPFDPEAFGDEIELAADFGNGRAGWRVSTLQIPFSLWSTDAATNSAQKLMDLPTFTLSKAVRLATRTFFLADDGTTGTELWTSDGTPAGTRVAFDYCPGPCDGFVNNQPRVVAGDRVFLTSGREPGQGFEPVLSDGTLAGTNALGDVCPGPCSTLPEFGLFDLGSAVIFTAQSGPNDTFQLWATDLTPEGTAPLTDFPGGAIPGALQADFFLFAGGDGTRGDELWKIALPDLDPIPPVGPWSSGPALPGFEVKVRISAEGSSRPGVLEPECISETLCFSGALPGRSEVFVRVVGPKPNGKLWPTLTKFTTSTVEIWIRQLSSGEINYYRLEGARPGFDELPGLFDRRGFAP